jgi:flagellar assembly protein FliH
VLAARALVEMPAAAIDEAIGRALRQVARGQEIAVAVAPELVGEVERLIAVRQGGDRRHLALTVVADAALPPGDAHVHWDQGGMVLDAAARAEAVRAALDGVLPR